jgi:hypothetical protein
MLFLRPFSFLFLLTPAAPLLAQEGAGIDSVALMKAMVDLFNSDAVKVEPVYTFQHQVSYTSEQTSLLGEEKKEAFTIHFSAGSEVIGIFQDMSDRNTPGQMFLVFDAGKMTTASFIKTDTMQLCMRMKVPDIGEEKEPVRFKASGKEREIAGMKAKEWVLEDKEEETHLWIADSEVGELGTAFRAFGRINGKPALGRGAYGNGLVLAGTFLRAGESAPFYSFEAKEVKLNTPYTFSSAGYRMGM